FLGACERTTRDTDIKLVRIADVRAMVDRQARGQKDVIGLIDPRPAKYYLQAHLPGARNITLPQIDPKTSIDPAIERFGTIVVYGDDPASAEARGMTKRLMAVGYSGVRLFAGGIREWTERGYPVEGTGPAKPAAPPPPPSEVPMTTPAP